MIKCPNCGQRILGDDLISGVCSHCKQRLTAGDSSLDSADMGATLPSAEVDEPESGSIKGQAAAGGLSGSEQTFLSDEFPADSDHDSNVVSSTDSRAGMGSGSEQTFLSDEVVGGERDSSPFATASASHQMQKPDTNYESGQDSGSEDASAQTFVSDSFDDADSGATVDSAVLSDEGESDKTIVSDDFVENEDPESAARTLIGDSFTGEESTAGDADKTFVSEEVPEALLKTIESVWGDDESQDNDRPDVTIKGKEAKHVKTPKQTLVIKTKSFSELQTGSLASVGSDEPEYELLKVLGEGGMGIVYDARQTSIDRNVAVKMLKPNTAGNEKQRAKFLAEAVVTGDLDHPNIVPIYDVGANAQGALFYSMKKVQGTPWLKVIQKKSLFENIDVLMKIADAVGFAHARGVVHRDLKPENVMLGEFGEVLVMDWGLAQAARTFRKSRSITETNTMGGTPAYMAPEMATGPLEKITPASDVYLLGAMLYEIITGGPPHVAKNAMKCLMAAARNEIAPTDKTGELVDIAMKAMATKAEDRYQDVKSFQAAIRDYQSHSESILLSTRAEDDLKEAYATDDYEHYSHALFGFQEAYALWSGNKRAFAGISEAKLAYASSAKRKGDFDLGLSLLDEQNPQHANLRRELLAAQDDRVARQKRLVFLKRAAMGLVAAVLVIVSGAALVIRSEQQKAVAEAIRATKAEKLAVAEADRATKAEKQAVAEADRATKAEKVALSEKTKAEAAAEQEKIAKLAAIESQKQEEKAKLAAIEAEKVAVVERKKAEDARKLEEKAKLAAVEAQKQEEKAKLAAVESQKQEEKAKVAAIESEKIAVSERKKAEEAKEKEEYEAYISKIGLAASQIDKNAFDAARDVLKTCKPELRNWEWGRLMHLCSQSRRDFDAEAPLDALAIDRQGQRFATGGWDGKARIWNRESGKVLHTLKHGGEYVHAVAFSPDGRFLATGSNDSIGFIQIWDCETGQRVKVIQGHEDAVLSIAFSKDGSRLLSGSYDKTARLWDVKTGEEVRAFRGHTWWVLSAAFSSDERRIVTAGQDGTAIVWDVASDKHTPAFTGHKGPVFSAAFSRDGKQVVTAGYDRRILAWNPDEVKPFDFKNVADGAVAAQADFRAFDGHADVVRSVSFSPDGTLLVSSGQDNTVRVWDFATGQALKTFRGHGGRVQAAQFLADGKRILSAAHDNTVREWSIAGYEEIRTLTGRVLDGHADAVLAAAYSQDQKQIITASRDRTARSWNALTGEPNLTFEEGHSYLASTALFFPDGHRLLTAAVDNTARVWDVSSGGQLFRLDRSGRSAAAALSHNAKRIATGGDDKSAQLWDASSGQRLMKLEGHLAEVTAVAFSPNDQWLATGDTKGHVKLWNMDDGRVVAKLDGHSRKITTIAFSRDGSRVLTASGDNTVGQWDVSTGQELPKLILKHPDGILTMQSVPNSDLFVTSCVDHKLRVWNAKDATVVQTLGPIEGAVFSLDVSSDGQRLIAANSEDRTVRMWELESGREIQSPRPGGQLGPLVDLKRHGGLLWSAAFVPGSDDVLTVGGSDARLWDVKTGTERMSFSPHGAVASARFSPDGQLIVTGSWDNSAKIWNATTGKVIRKLEGGHTSFVNTAVFSPSGKFVLTASDDGTAKLWNVETGVVVKTLAGHTDRVRSASYSPKGEYIVTTANDKTARLWNGDSGEFIREFKGHEWAVLCADFSTDGEWLVTGSEDNTARIWNVETAENPLSLAGHTASITSVAFSPDAARVITGSQDQSAKLWDAKTGKEILTLSRHTEDVTSVAFSPDGRQVLTGSRDGTAVIWLSQQWTAAEDVTATRDELRQPKPLSR